MSQPDDEPRIIKFDEINKEPPGDEFLPTAEEAAAYLRVSTKTARHLLRSGAIPASKVGRGWRVFREDLDAYVRSRDGRPRAALAPAGASPGEGNPDQEEGA